MKPDFETLQGLYEGQRLTTRQIGEMYNTSKTSVIRWLKAYNIPLRDSHNGLLNRGIVAPTKEELYTWVHVDHKSYVEIASMFNVDHSAVGYWLKKYDIPRPKIWDTRYKNNKPPEPTEEELRELYVEQGLSLIEIGARYNMKLFAIRERLRKFNIPIKTGGWSGVLVQCKDGHLVRSVYEQRVDDWLFDHNISHVYEPQLSFDKRFHADFLANGYYIEVWGVRKNPIYQRRKYYKIQMYKQHNLPLIQLDDNRFHKGTWEKHLMKFFLPSN